jgi:hypothetical protein
MREKSITLKAAARRSSGAAILGDPPARRSSGDPRRDDPPARRSSVSDILGGV